MPDLPNILQIPVIRHTSSDPPRYITSVRYELTSPDTEISALESAVLAVLNKRATSLQLPQSGSKSVAIWKLNDPLVPSGSSLGAYKETYQQVNEAYLEAHAFPCANLVPVFPHGHLVAVLGMTHPPQPLQHLDDSQAVARTTVIEYKDVFIKLASFGGFLDDDLQLNQVSDAGASPVPEFVSDFKERLESKPRITRILDCDQGAIADAYEILDNSRSGQMVEQDWAPDESPTRIAGEFEILLVQHVAWPGWEIFWQTHGQQAFGQQAFKQDMADALFFLGLILCVPQNTNIVARRHTNSWPFKLIITSDNLTLRGNIQINTEDIRTFQPRSDFSLWRCGLPRLIVEVQSGRLQPNRSLPEDCVKMLLEGAAIVRLANAFVNPFKTWKNFVLVAVYFFSDGTVYRYLLYQSESHAVQFNQEVFSLTKPCDRVRITRGLHNLVHALADEEDDGGTAEDVKTFNDKIRAATKDLNLRSLNDTRAAKRKRTGNDSGAGIGASAGEGASAVEEGTADARADAAVLRSVGYEVIPNIIVDEDGGEWGQLFSLPAHVLRVYKTPNESRIFIAKKVRQDSEEAKILKLLHSIKQGPGCEHVIRMLESVDTPSGSWVILPKLTSIDECLYWDPAALHPYVGRVCTGLIEGLAYLHGMLVAHRDIKPANLVVDESFCLKIIDFDLSIQLQDEDEEVDDECGTKQWTAPEVWQSVVYSPIRADRWSCGRVVLYLLDEATAADEPLRSFAVTLMTDNPQRRPSLAEWRLKSGTPTPPIVASRVRLRSPEAAEAHHAKRPRMTPSWQNALPLSDVQRLWITATPTCAR